MCGNRWVSGRCGVGFGVKLNLVFCGGGGGGGGLEMSMVEEDGGFGG